ncbi:putative ATP synthase subunit f, mitochondrial [Aedes aegypti]|uniref:Uncharacterized protein n=1 Tax=Aedes aegypti TaxID=7159 RepID=A0A6I8U2W6_AEDAE|nr:putative ATP synthase subunit f, mitochondrial [Aedes aegypti]
MTFGDYPAEYNPKVHGPYDPARYFGMPDTPLGQANRVLGLAAVTRTQGCRWGRAFWSWKHKYSQLSFAESRLTVTYINFVSVSPSQVFFYAINYGKLKHHRNYKYH